MREVELEDRSLLICRINGAWHALDNLCTHAYAKLTDGRLRGVKLICPLHGGVFDCRTGAAIGRPAVLPLRVYPVRIVGDRVEVAI